MSKLIRFQKELEKIKKIILSLGTMVEDRVRKAGKLIESRDAFDAGRLIKSDYEIDEMEVEVEEECLKIIALHQPVAVDLRFLIAVIKINNDLERIADEAVNIAQRIEIITKNKSFEFVFDYSVMVEKVEDMLKKSLDALVYFDTDIAFKVCLLDDEVDKIHRDAYDRIKQAMEKRPEHIRYLLNLFLISRHLERIGDHATNIAEEVIYMTEGEIVRHGKYLNEK
ncbi:phosphate signaling complex protein PhoU [Desulfonema magnum]|uniref:Phosphate-specific transport system accessory protein PhoU n=1 Tax=Desulfonema magnum TaxID=45655 RepID=A0A975GQS4_9BACT|nr:phosphate signaling complex protein PhoU [Desulfonema magnum]QTA90341.1 Phosphate-specific transport system accessory protein [Desulfonema magnum]